MVTLCKLISQLAVPYGISFRNLNCEKGNVNSIYLIIGGGTPGLVRLHRGNLCDSYTFIAPYVETNKTGHHRTEGRSSLLLVRGTARSPFISRTDCRPVIRLQMQSIATPSTRSKVGLQSLPPSPSVVPGRPCLRPRCRAFSSTASLSTWQSTKQFNVLSTPEKRGTHA